MGDNTPGLFADSDNVFIRVFMKYTNYQVIYMNTDIMNKNVNDRETVPA